MLKEKWTGMGVVNALLLTITVPLLLTPPAGLCNGGDNSDNSCSVLKAFRVCMALSCTASTLCILLSTFWLDILNTFSPAPSDVVFFQSTGYRDDPVILLFITILSAVTGIAVALSSLMTSTEMYAILGLFALLNAVFITRWIKLIKDVTDRNKLRYNKLAPNISTGSSVGVSS